MIHRLIPTTIAQSLFGPVQPNSQPQKQVVSFPRTNLIHKTVAESWERANSFTNFFSPLSRKPATQITPGVSNFLKLGLANFFCASPAWANSFNDFSQQYPLTTLLGIIAVITGPLITLSRYAWLQSIKFEAQELKNRQELVPQKSDYLDNEARAPHDLGQYSTSERTTFHIKANLIDRGNLESIASQDDGFAFLKYLATHHRDRCNMETIYRVMAQIDESRTIQFIETLALKTSDDAIFENCLMALKSRDTKESQEAIANLALKTPQAKKRKIALYYAFHYLPKEKALATLYSAVFSDHNFVNRQIAICDLLNLDHMAVCDLLKSIASHHYDLNTRYYAINCLFEKYPDASAAFTASRYLLDPAVKIKETILHQLGTSKRYSQKVAYAELWQYMRTPREKFLYRIFFEMGKKMTEKNHWVQEVADA